MPLRSSRRKSVERIIQDRPNTLSQESHPTVQERDTITEPRLQFNQAVRRSNDYSTLRMPRHRTRSILGDIGNVELRKLLSDRNPLNKTAFSPVEPKARRVASDPTPGTANNPTRSKEFDVPESLSDAGSSPITIVNIQEQKQGSCSSIPRTLEVPTEVSEMTRVLQGVRLPDVQKFRKVSLEDPIVTAAGSLIFVPLLMSIIQRLEGPDKPPIGTTRPTQFNTSSIKCQSHKTTYGQVTILPSHSVLVDFRESQRRRGLVGDEILLIDWDGSKVCQI